MTDRRDFCALIAAMGLLQVPGRAQGQGAAGAWKLATGYRAESFHGQNLLQFIKEVDGSGLKIELQPNNSLFKLAEIAGAVQGGKVECGETIMTSLVKDMPLAGADSVPFIVRSYDDARRLWKHQKPLIEKKFAATGLKPLFAVPWPPQGLYTNKPINRAADLKGSKMRTYNSTTQRIAQLLGATPVDVPMVQVGQALADGRIDCMITSAVTGVENQVWDYVKNYYEINAWFPKNITFANAKAFAALPAATQKAVMDAAASAEKRGWAASEKAAADSVEELRKHGMKIERVSSEFLADIKRMGERFSLEWVREVGNEANDIFIPYYTNQ
jgi:TRAP-type C4-dicarboxylate transport system substrate-binding protein